MELARLFGGRLFVAVMEGKVGELYRSAFSEARAAGLGASGHAVADGGAGSWAAPVGIPHDSTTSCRSRRGRPSCARWTCRSPAEPWRCSSRSGILAVVCLHLFPRQPLDASAEWGEARDRAQATVRQGAVEIDWLEEPKNAGAPAQKMRSDTYHILHSPSAMAASMKRRAKGALLFRGEGGRGRLVSGDTLAPVLKDKVALLLVVLNSCEGSRNLGGRPVLRRGHEPGRAPGSRR